MPKIELIQGDCLEKMKDIPDKSIDMILCDLPYGTTDSGWDKIIDSVKMWEQYKRIISDNGAIVLFASGSFTNKLINSNEKIYRYKWIWFKTKRGNFVNAKNRPMTAYEEICIFSQGVTANGCNNKMKYFPQGLKPIYKVNKDGGSRFGTMAGKRPSHQKITIQEFTNYPFDVLQFDSVGKPIHPTEKPVDLLEYLIKTYTNEGDTVLDNCMGSGTTGVACKNLNRNFIGIELDLEYFKIAEKRINENLSENTPVESNGI
jgi:site-specific DNA-methyltransferase (adenine-specific)